MVKATKIIVSKIEKKMFKQNRVFKKDQGRILGLLDATDEAPDSDATFKFWTGLLSRNQEYKWDGEHFKKMTERTLANNAK